MPSAAWTTEAQKPHGEALVPRLKVRLNDLFENRLLDSGDPTSANWDSWGLTLGEDANESGPNGGRVYTMTTTASSPGQLWQTFPLAYFMTSYYQSRKRVIVRGVFRAGTSDGGRLRLSYYVDPTWTTLVEDGWTWDASDRPVWQGSAPSGVTRHREYMGDGWWRLSMEWEPDVDLSSLYVSAYWLCNYASGQSSGLTNDFCEPQVMVDPAVTGYTETTSERVEDTGQPGTLVTVSDESAILEVSEIPRKRELRYGVAKGQSWQVKLSDAQLVQAGRDLAGCWALLEAGFPNAGEWETIAQGQIRRAVRRTDGTVTLEVGEAVLGLVGARLERDIYFGASGWASNLQREVTDKDSSSYDNDYDSDGVDEGVTVLSGGAAKDETFVVEFDSATTFKVILEDGRESSSFSISSDADFGNMTQGISASVFRIEAEGWDQAADAYTTGDRFVFFSAASRTSYYRSVLRMVRHIIEDVAGVRVYDVASGDYYSSPCYDATGWATLELETASDEVGGFWPRGSRIIEMVQELLALAHASILPTPTGQVGLWLLQPNTGGAATLTGAPDAADGVQILSAQLDEELQGTHDAVHLTYRALGSGDDVTIVRGVDHPVPGTKPLVVETSWRVRALSASACVSKAVNRFAEARRVIRINATLAAAAIGLSGGVTITEPFLALSQAAADVAEVSLAIMDQTARVVAWQDPVAMQDAARIGISEIGGSDTIW